ncbi:MAG TPA: dipeptidyl aminopeptidase [Ramlibacter sp.]|uniref:dienelactone hydrolase family protein n=1 Tax=Ramlibacter sp. TaxID=1917967 RepID=UPI002D1AD7E7|nr:dipeptidyl aminopeptidase [Ramlibacter sp.]HVZ44445.1 dipeptidyl aminopeptidase [Ramlibacter sp.]
MRAQLVRVPVEFADGTRVSMPVHVFKPPGAGPFPVVFYLHGRPANRAARRAMVAPIAAGHVRWWLGHGVAVIAPLRPGYGGVGAAGGADKEDTGARWRGGECIGEPDFMRAAAAIGQSTLAAYHWAIAQPWVDRERLGVEGWSMGGLGSIAVASLNLAGVRGVINFSGGTAGNPIDAPGHSCRPDLLAQTYRDLGRVVHEPTLWLYAENDGYWGPQAPRMWFAAFRGGGSDAELVMTAPVEGADGHELLMEGPELWMERVEAFIRKAGLVS